VEKENTHLSFMSPKSRRADAMPLNVTPEQTIDKGNNLEVNGNTNDSANANTTANANVNINDTLQSLDTKLWSGIKTLLNEELRMGHGNIGSRQKKEQKLLDSIVVTVIKAGAGSISQEKIRSELGISINLFQKIQCCVLSEMEQKGEPFSELETFL